MHVMVVFVNNNGKLTGIAEVPFKLEKEMQELTENNLDHIFKPELEFVKSELELSGFRIDTLGFDNETKSFVIIEYKKERNYNFMDQGWAYLSLLLNNKAEFILAYNERKNKSQRKEDVDWTQSKIIFLAPSFTKHQQQALGFKDLPFELWEVKRYANKTVIYSQLKSPESKESVTTLIGKNKIVQQVTKEVRVYTEEDHMKLGSEKTRELYYALKSAILNLGADITIKPVKRYIAFKRKTNFTDIIIQRSKLIVYINLPSGKLNDPHKLARDTAKGHWGNGDYEVHLSDHNPINYLLTLISQSYESNLSIRGLFSQSKA